MGVKWGTICQLYGEFDDLKSYAAQGYYNINQNLYNYQYNDIFLLGKQKLRKSKFSPTPFESNKMRTAAKKFLIYLYSPSVKIL